MGRNIKHQKAQKAGRKRDGNICQICGSINCSEGHHMVDYRFGGAASIDNIVTLCRPCHKEVHRGNISVFRI